MKLSFKYKKVIFVTGILIVIVFLSYTSFCSFLADRYYQKAKKLSDNVKNWQKATIYYEKALSITPGNAEYHDEAGKLYSRLFMLYGDEEYFEKKAASHFKKSYRLNPYNAWAHYHLAWCYLGKRMYTQAEKEAKQAIRLDPNNATYHWQLAAIYERMGKLEKAKDEYQEVLRIIPGYSKAKRALKRIEKKLKNIKSPL